MSETAEITENIAKTAAQYDQMPYESKPFPQSQPSRLGAIAKLFGLSAPPLKNCRVLELGCASGGNLVPLALLHPEAEFVGVDVSQRQVDAGRARIEKLGIKNFRLLCKSFTELAEDAGKFDYIICHGVYSWIPRALQDAIMSVIKARLSPEGVAFVSYNVLPGWRMLQPIRDAFLSVLPPGLEGTEKVKAAIELAQFVSEASEGSGAYGEAFDWWLERFKTVRLDYIAHEYLEDTNDPIMFKDFAGRAAAHGLAYLGESDFQTMVAEHYPPHVAEEIHRRAGGDMIAAEQLMDVVSGRKFRQTLLVHHSRAPLINRQLTPDALNGLHLVGSMGMELKEEAEQTIIRIGGQDAYTVKNNAMRKALAKFFDRFPAGSQVSDLAVGDEALSDVKKGFYSLVIAGLVVPFSEPVQAAATPANYPRASSLVLREARMSLPFTTNLRHELVGLEPATIFLLSKMDGSKNQEELIQLLAEEGRSGRIIFFKDEKKADTLEEAADFARYHAPMLIANLAKAALLVN